MSEAADRPLPETLDGGRYRIEKLLGEGGNATVLLALDTRMGVRRAIKLLRPEAARSAANRARFKGEAHAQADLKHPNVLMVHDAVEDQQGVYLVMELAENDSLKERVTEQGPMSVAEVIEVGVVIGRALAVAHARGLVHRDIKPANILVDRHGVLKLADFGIALGAGSHVTMEGVVMGTWAFMSPEQRDDSHAVDARSDIYAFGITLYALLKGTVPPNPYNKKAWAEAFDGVPPELEAVLQRATKIYPEERYSHIEELVTDLLAIRDQSGKTLPRAPALTIGVTSSVGLADPTHIDELLPPPEVKPAPTPTLSAPPPAPNSARSSPPTLAIAEPDNTRALLWGFGLTLGGVVVLGLLVVAGILAWRSTQQSAPASASAPPATTAPATEVPPEPPSTSAAPEPAVEARAPSTSAQPVVPPKAPPPTGTSATPVAAASTKVPEPVKTSKAPTIIVVNPSATEGGASGSTNVDTPTTEAPKAVTGRVMVTTVPSGASVRNRGRTLSPAPSGGYELPVGSHTLQLTSPSGESTSVAVSVRAGESVDICYSFDTNSMCGR